MKYFSKIILTDCQNAFMSQKRKSKKLYFKFWHIRINNILRNPSIYKQCIWICMYVYVHKLYVCKNFYVNEMKKSNKYVCAVYLGANAVSDVMSVVECCCCWMKGSLCVNRLQTTKQFPFPRNFVVVSCFHFLWNIYISTYFIFPYQCLYPFALSVYGLIQDKCCR